MSAVHQSIHSQVIKITREKLYATPGCNVRFAWKWLYSVDGVAIGTLLAEARGWAKRRFPSATIVEAWKGVAS